MIDLTLTEKFALIGLKNQRSTQLTMPKKASLRCLAAAVTVDYFEMKDSNTNIPSYISDIYDLLSDKQNLKETLETVETLSKKSLKTIETIMIAHLREKHFIREKNSLLSCDLEFETAGIKVKEYVVNEAIYQSFIEPFRAELLEGFEIDNETIALLWLCKESGSLKEMFSESELIQVAQRYDELYETNSFAKDLYEIVIHKTSEGMVKKILQRKTEDIKTSFGSGLNFIFPVIERSQAVFIESEAYFADKDQLLSSVQEKLNTFNIHYELITKGDVPLLKIDGIYYEAVPFAKFYKMPVHGVQLRKYPAALHV